MIAEREPTAARRAYDLEPDLRELAESDARGVPLAEPPRGSGHLSEDCRSLAESSIPQPARTACCVQRGVHERL